MFAISDAAEDHLHEIFLLIRDNQHKSPEVRTVKDLFCERMDRGEGHLKPAIFAARGPRSTSF